jgi:hypothetical protein
MTADKRPPRKSSAPPPIPVPRIRTIRSDEIAAPNEATETAQMRPRRNRKPKFVF